ncbi:MULTISPECIES: ABC transporter permease [unclassified Streptococcus]|uniref:ABC transporter permease n=1 Tax=unclassified Streptococcus TaxID=2608887 RepID=UPI002A8EEC4A|nr:ABC transporter permease [Streptococcus sp.]MDY3823986.1 ABC transporter permease [Streptococcus sp.]
MSGLVLQWYKFKNSYQDFLKVIIGIVAFESLILFIQEKDFLTYFEGSRMTTFLLLFSSSLLILVQTSITVSKERAILDRDFFSGLDRIKFSLATIFFHSLLAIVESLVFVLFYLVLLKWFDFDYPNKGQLLSHFGIEILLTTILVFLSAHYLGLIISAISGKSEITSVILAVIVGISQFSLAGTILQLPKSIKGIEQMMFLGYGHRLFAMSHDLYHLPSSMQKFGIPIPKEQLQWFKVQSSTIEDYWIILLIHAIIYAGVFVLLMRFKKK